MMSLNTFMKPISPLLLKASRISSPIRLDLQSILSIIFLERTAEKGRGRYFYSGNAQELADAFQDIVNEILEKSSSFVAPLVPVSRLERTTCRGQNLFGLISTCQGRDVERERQEVWCGSRE